MGDDQENIDAIPLPWKPPYSAEARAAFQEAICEARDTYVPTYVRSEHWHLGVAEIGRAVAPYLARLLDDPARMSGFGPNSFDKHDVDTWHLLAHFGDCRVLPAASEIDLIGTIGDELVIFLPYELLEKDSLLLHTREEWLQALAEHVPYDPCRRGDHDHEGFRNFSPEIPSP